ncbi:MAG: choice-of-anchor tandem repeat GloVer-containing protein [Verrucomicrobiota bacterium]
MNANRYVRRVCALIPVIGILTACTSFSRAQVYEKVFSFTDARAQDSANSKSRGSGPNSDLIQAADGNFYGTTPAGNGSGYGTVFKLTPAGALTTLADFPGGGATNIGGGPGAGLVQGRDGNFYGTSGGGASHNGRIFRLTPAGVLTTLVEFTRDGGNTPSGGLVLGSDGNFYGTTERGGTSVFDGTVFKMTPAGVLTTLVNFKGVFGSSNKGSNPVGGLVPGPDGSFYGVTSGGGSHGSGTVFKMTSTGALTTLVNFKYNDPAGKGSGPTAGLVFGSDGNFYGTTYSGGMFDQGTVFRMTPAGVLTTLVHFTGGGPVNKGGKPWAKLVEGIDGNFYGTTALGGASDNGTVFKMTPAGALTTLVEFTDKGSINKGSYPAAGLVLGSDGNFRGTTLYGGASGKGTLFKMTSAGVLTTLVEFTGTSDIGSAPEAALVLGSDECFYGTTFFGGASDQGTVFKLTPAGSVSTLVEFRGNDGLPDTAFYPAAGLVQGSDGDFYGTTTNGGVPGHGTVFKMTPAGVKTTLVEFTGDGAANKGSYPDTGLVPGSDGNFYGTTNAGGPSGFGTVFKLTPAGALTTLVKFTGSRGSKKGSHPAGSLLRGHDGNFYGATFRGGKFDKGTVFKLTPSGVMTTLVEFSGKGTTGKGINPSGGLVEDSSGNFYGATSSGGASGKGTIFKLNSSGVVTTLVEFSGHGKTNKGRSPLGSLVKGIDGNFYGTTYGGGPFGYGTVFKMTPAGKLTTLVTFATSEDGKPNAGLIRDSKGNMYGTTGGPDGSIYRLLFPGPPLVSMAGVTPQGINGAVLEARVNARGAATTVSLEFGTDGVNFPNSQPVANNLRGYQTKLMGATLGSLEPGTIYYYRFRAASSAGTTVSPVASFSTLAEPVVATTAASEITATSARFNATVNSRNYDATALFEWGTDGNTFPNRVAPTPDNVSGNSPVVVSAPVGGLQKGSTCYYRIIAANAAGTIVGGSQSFTVLTDPVATVGQASAVTAQSARLNGSVNAHGAEASVYFEYGTDRVNFPDSVGAQPSTVTGNTSTAVTANLDGLAQGTTYYYRVKATSAGGQGESSASSFVLDILSGYTQAFPGTIPSAEGFIVVNLTPSGPLVGWRFAGEQQWRASGVPVAGLTTGDRDIEFRPVPGYIQPPGETVSITSGAAATVLERDYYETETSGNGGIGVTLKPDSIAEETVPLTDRGQWRLLGEDDTQWRDSGTTLNGLIAGSYLIECKPLEGHATPPPATVIVEAGGTGALTLTYFLADARTGAPPAALAFETLADSTKPYAYVGQIRSNAGSSTGFVVKQRVVATAGHVVFDDGTLSAVGNLQWLFQRDRGTHEPKPQIPRGFYIFDGYAAQRELENTPGISSPQSQNLDVGAMYFLEDAGRGGFGGFLASDLAANEFLLSPALKTLVGYPVDGIPALSQGRMHATPPENLIFSSAFGRTFTTSGIHSRGGNSGGPLCVRIEEGNYYAAAIYLGGTAQTVVRAIDSNVIDLFNRAETSGDGGENQTGGGITHSNFSPIGSISQPGALEVTIQPAAARNAGAGWRLKPETSYRPSGSRKTGLRAGGYVLQLNSVNGFQVPTKQTVNVTGGQLRQITFTYLEADAASEIPNQPDSVDDATGSITLAVGDDDLTNCNPFFAAITDNPLEIWRFANFGTDPDLAADVFRIISANKSPSAFTITALGKAGRSYWLERSYTLAPGSWTPADSAGPLDSDGTVELIDDSTPPENKSLYRVRVTCP